MSVSSVSRQALRRATVTATRSASRPFLPEATAQQALACTQTPPQFRCHSSHSGIVSRNRRPAGRSSRPSPLDASRIGRRTLFIQTENTPNADALKFKPNARVLPEDLPTTFLEYLSPRSTLQPPYPSPLAGDLLNVDGVTAVFYGADYITITKDSGAEWGHVKPEIFSLITEAVSAGRPMVNKVEGTSEDGAGIEQDTLMADDDDSEVVSMIKELLETRIRPAIQEDGGDIDYRGFHDGWVKLKLRGACRTCDSSTVTLRNGIESMLMHYVEEVQGVEQIMDEEEQVAMQEFAKFEEKLKAQKGDQAVASTGGKGTLDAAV